MAPRNPSFTAALAVAASVSGAVTSLETLAPMKRDVLQL